MRHAGLAVAVLAASLATGCGDDDAGAGRTLHASCDVRTTAGQCAYFDLTGAMAATGISNVRDNCTNAGGIYGATCNPAGAVGSCLVVSGSARTEVWFYPPLWSTALAEAGCMEFGGTWTAP